VSELLRQLLDRRESLAQHLAAIDRLIALEQVQPASSAQSPVSVRATVPAPKRGERGVSSESLAGQILAIMNTAPDEVWTSSEITRQIQESNPAPDAYRLPMDDLKARNAVSATMGQLWRTGRLRQVSASNGAVPARYQLPNGKEVPSEEKTS